MPEHLFSRLRGAGAALLGALVFVVLLTGAIARQPGIEFKTDADLPTPTSGFYPFEQSGTLAYAWTGSRADLSIPGIDRRIPWRWTARAMLWRPVGAPPPTVRIAVDGILTLEQTITRDLEPITILLPPSPDKTGAILSIETTPVFVPGGTDTRRLGVALASMSLVPERGVPRPSRLALLDGTTAVLALGISLAAMSVPPLAVFVGTAAAAIGETWAVTRGATAYSSYVTHSMVLAMALALGSWLLVRIVGALRREPLGTGALVVAACSTVACYLKLLVLLHPAMTIGDGLFHAHRFESVLSGHFYFTSIAPGNYSFPYPILLYLVAAPFSRLAPDTLSHVALLRIIVTVADAVAGALLYWMIVRTTADRLAGVAAVVWYHLVPMTGWIMAWGNLTNAFGQPLFVASLAAIVALPIDSTKPRSVWVVSAIAAAALLSHPSTCAILVIVLGVTAFLYVFHGNPPLTRAARGIGVAGAIAAVAALVLYYAWFPSVYVHELGRAASESGTRLSAASPGWSMSRRIASVPELAGNYLGWPALAAAAAGAWRVRSADRTSRLARLLAGWGGTCLAFLLLGIVTPIQMRTHFAAFPAVAVAAAYGISWAWRGGLPLRVCAIVVAAAGVWIGLRQWIGLLG